LSQAALTEVAAAKKNTALIILNRDEFVDSCSNNGRAGSSIIVSVQLK
jgi:putative cell wall-binding protein